MQKDNDAFLKEAFSYSPTVLGKKGACHLKRSKNTKPFHKLCNSIEASKLRDLTNTMPMTKPRKVRGSMRWRLKCASANATALTMMEPQTGK